MRSQKSAKGINADLFAPDYKAAPYWWDRTPRPVFEDVPLPAKADVVVIGSGYTGLSAALQTARAGRHTVVLDAEDIGWGCSTRNGGQVATGLSGAGYPQLVHKYGEAMANDIVREGHNALEWIEEFVKSEGIDCDFRRSGRLYGAHSARAYEALARKFGAKLPEGLQTGSYMVPKSELKSEIDTELYHGGAVQPRHAALDPARYHQGMLDKVLEAGASVIAQCAALNIDRQKDGLVVATSKGDIAARDVVVASNGYTGRATPWMRNRIIPLGSYILATEPLEKEVIDRLLPTDRMIVDTRKMVVYYRTCPERRRIIFGGRVSVSEPDPDITAPPLHKQMVRIFPELAPTRISHMWMGLVGFSFDHLPHMGRQDGVHYAMGYCGSGVSLAGYMGMRIGQQIAGLPEGDSPLLRTEFQARAYYRGNPWFMRPALYYYKMRDAMS